MTASSTEVGSDSLYTNLTNTQPDRRLGFGGGDQHQQGPARSFLGLDHPSTSRDSVRHSPTFIIRGAEHSPPRQDPPIRKRSDPPTGSDTLPGDARPSKRPCRPARLVLRKEKSLTHRHYRHKAWGVEDLDDFYRAENGSLQRVVRWESTVVAEGDLTGSLRERYKELFKEKFGAGEWEKWGTTNRRTKSTR